jgi:hypothetical protein
MRRQAITGPGGDRSITIALAAIGAVAAYGVAYAYFKWLPRYDCIVLPLLVAAVFAALERVSRIARLVTLTATSLLLLFAFLLHLWTLGYEGRNAVFGGILPWSDSHGFYSDALRLVHGERFSTASSRRPLFAALLAMLLRASDGNLRVALATVTVASAFAITLPVLAVWRTVRWPGAAILYLVLLFFERRFTGFVQSEHFGLPLGALGFAALWRANALRGEDDARRGAPPQAAHVTSSLGPWLALSGTFAVTLGLLARAGAFFVLPALCLWTARAFPMPGRGGRWKTFLAAVSAAGVAFGVNRWVFDRVGTGVTFSDYPAIGYGLVHGEDFTYLLATHPSLASLGFVERVTASWHILATEARQHPLWVLRGLGRSELEFFLSPFGVFSYVWTNPDDRIFENAALMRQRIAENGILGPLEYWQQTLGVGSIVNSLCMGLLGAALVVGIIASLFRLARPPRRADESLFRGAALGVLASAPFTPPWITSGVQIQTVTLAFVAALPAVAFFRRTPFPPRPQDEEPRLGGAGATSWLIALAPSFAGAYVLALELLRFFPAHPPPCDPASPPPLRVDRSTIIEVARERSFAFSRKAEADLLASLVFLRKHFPEFALSLQPSIHPGTIFASAYDVCRGEAEVLVDPDRILSRDFEPGAGTASAPRLWVGLELSDLLDPSVRLVRGSASSSAHTLPPENVSAPDPARP